MALLDLAPLERPGEAAVRLRIAREQQTARGVTVEPMYGKRPALETETQAVEMILEAQAAVARRIDRQAIGLVDDVGRAIRSEEQTSELQSLIRISNAFLCYI